MQPKQDFEHQFSQLQHRFDDAALSVYLRALEYSEGILPDYDTRFNGSECPDNQFRLRREST